MAAPRKPPIVWIVLGGVAAVVVLCASAAAVTYFAIRDEVSETIGATETRVVAPETLGGRPMSNDPELRRLANRMASGVEADLPDATSTIGAFYGDAASGDLVMIMGVSVIMMSPRREIEDAIVGFGASDVVEIDPGPLGGEARCGDAEESDLPLGVCGWADRGSLGLILAYDSSGQELAADFITFRGEIQQS